MPLAVGGFRPTVANQQSMLPREWQLNRTQHSFAADAASVTFMRTVGESRPRLKMRLSGPRPTLIERRLAAIRALDNP